MTPNAHELVTRVALSSSSSSTYFLAHEPEQSTLITQLDSLTPPKHGKMDEMQSYFQLDTKYSLCSIVVESFSF